MANKKYRVEYKTKIFTENGYLVPDGFSSVVFRNIGSDEAKIMKDIPVTTSGEDYALINREYCIIDYSITVEFETTTAPKVLAVMVYYYPI